MKDVVFYSFLIEIYRTGSYGTVRIRTPEKDIAFKNQFLFNFFRGIKFDQIIHKH